MKQLLRAAAKSSSGMFATLLSAAVAVKVIALVAGPAGVGLFSLLRQTQQTAAIIGSLGGQAAIVQVLASQDAGKRAASYVSVLRAVLLCSVLVCCLLVASAGLLAPLILGSGESYVTLLRLLAIPAVLGSATLFFSGVINSERAVGALAVVQISAGLTLAMAAYPLSRGAQGPAFVLLLTLSGLAGLLAALFFCWKNGWLAPLAQLLRRGGGASMRPFLKIGGTTLLTGLMSTGTVLAVRALVGKHMGLHGAGLFDAAWTLSMTYVMLILSSFSTFYLPTLSAIQSGDPQRKHLIEQVFRFATYASIPLVGTVMLLRPWIIELLYSQQFVPAAGMMRWMLLGDYLKITAWVLAMPMLAFADMRTFFLSELVWNTGFLTGVALLLAGGGGLEYIGLLFFALYAGYLLFSYQYSARRYQFTIPKTTGAAWLAGLALLGLLAWRG